MFCPAAACFSIWIGKMTFFQIFFFYFSSGFYFFCRILGSTFLFQIDLYFYFQIFSQKIKRVNIKHATKTFGVDEKVVLCVLLEIENFFSSTKKNHPHFTRRTFTPLWRLLMQTVKSSMKRGKSEWLKYLDLLIGLKHWPTFSAVNITQLFNLYNTV